ncbi:auxin-responsive protein SAUR71-like [Dendrobium catenatum]|uniref:auxin-responsive protein SAUR71-like n=1 Tax=Dendrobium catenatum TaxID=906689 RepID=UPI0009F1B092|nr:auxin-responsive protein SAUR71-like [Dendrobium catenatum]
MKKLIRRLAKVADSSQYEPLEAAGKRDARRARVPAGHIPVFVGEEMERFAVPAEFLGRPPFVELLRRTAMEFGYDQVGVLRISCSVHLFRRLLLTAETDAGDDFVAEELARPLQYSDHSAC